MKKFLARIGAFVINITISSITAEAKEKYDIDAVGTYTCTWGVGNWGWTKKPTLTGYIKWVDNVKGGLKVQTSTSFKW